MPNKYEALLGQALHDPFCDANRINTAIALFNSVASLTQQCVSNLSTFGLPDGQFVCLLLLRHFGHTTPSTLSDNAGLTRSGITVALDKLEARGLIRRHHQQDDRRTWKIEITEQGNQVLDEILPSHFKWLSELTAQLDDQEVNTLKTLLEKLSKTLNE